MKENLQCLDEKLLSIIIPSFNMERLLGACLNSLCVKELELFGRLEIIVVNDGSTDATSEIAHKFQLHHPDVVRVIDKSNGHYGSCVNAGLRVATGRYVRLLDADDCFDTEAFTEFLRELSKLAVAQDSVDLVWTDYRKVDSNGAEICKIRHSLVPRVRVGLDNLTGIPEDRTMPSATFRRDLINQIEYVQTEGMAYTDTEWMFAPIIAVKSLCYLPLVVYNYLIGREGQSTDAVVVRRQLYMLRETFRTRAKYYAENKDSWDKSSLRYAQSELARAATNVYRAHLMFCPCIGSEDIVRVDDIATLYLSDIKSRLGEADVMFPGKAYSIPYGKTYAKPGFLRVLVACSLKLKALIS